MRHALRIAAVSLGLAGLIPGVAMAQAVDAYRAPAPTWSSASNWNSAPSNQHVDAQQQNQKARIRQGVQSGQLTHHEARGLRQDQRQVNRLQRATEADGIVTPQERQAVRQANRANSREIYQQKHDGQERPHFGW